MVSNRCILAVKDELRKMGLDFVVVNLGEVEIIEDLTDSQKGDLQNSLNQIGLVILDDKKTVLVEKIKHAIIGMIYDSNSLVKVNFSDYLSEKLGQDYAYLSSLFSEVQGITIAQFIISHKIERIKELIIYDELNITEIAWKLNYSSVSHLSNQFKKMTGLSPSDFKNLKEKRNLPIEDIGGVPRLTNHREEG